MQTLFPDSAPTANPVFFRTYSRSTPDGRESWAAVVKRTVESISEIGKLTQEESELLEKMQSELKVLPSGRWLWVGGTNWILNPQNFSGAYNCTSTNLVDWGAFGLMMDLAMMGSGTGAIIEDKHIAQLRPIRNKLQVKIIRDIGVVPAGERLHETSINRVNDPTEITLQVGDSRRGWVNSYQALLELASETGADEIVVRIDLGHVRPTGERLNGFGGVSNPVKLPELYGRVAAILNGARGRRLTSLECCLLIDEAALVVVAGNVRRSAGMRQFSADDQAASAAKDNLWQQDESGSWIIDPERDALRMANHTRIFHTRPSHSDVLEAVTKQFYSGEGAIQFAPEAIARANADILSNRTARNWFIKLYCAKEKQAAADYLRMRKSGIDEAEMEHRLGRYGLNPCFAAGTMVMTREGHFPIESLISKEVEVHDGSKWVKINNFRVTGQNQKVYNVEFHSGQIITATAYHKFILEDGTRVELKDLQPGMRLAPAVTSIEGTIDARAAYLKGFLIGDGTADSSTGVPSCKLYEPKRVCLARLVASQREMPMRVMVAANGRTVGDDYGLPNSGYLKNLNHEDSEWMLPWCSVYKYEFPREVLNWTPRCQQDFIAGLFDADGTAMDTTNGHGYQITSVSRSFLQGLGLLLTGLGIRWKIGPVRKGGKKDWGERGGICNAQDTYRLAVPQASSIRLARMVVFERLKSFAERTSAYGTKDNSFKVASVTYSHTADEVFCCTVPDTHSFTLTAGIITAQCGEIIGSDFHCNLAEVHLNQLDPTDKKAQDVAFEAASLAVASLLHHRFEVHRYRVSRELDPIVGVSFTGLFDFFVNAFGASWLEWWAAGRPHTSDGEHFRHEEVTYLSRWKDVVQDAVADYCQRHGLKVPNRCTTVQPAGTKSLLTGASPGWHPPKAQRFIRRITFGKNDPVALACIDYGYTVVPGQGDKDEQGRLLDDPLDPRCSEWLVEIPTEVNWANLPGADAVDINGFSALAQFDFYMQVQKHYTTHNTSATIEYREDEIEPLASRIHQAIDGDEGYISAALLARFDANETFPRMPFEPIDRETYLRLQEGVLSRRKVDDFLEAIRNYDHGPRMEAGPAGCDSDKCLLPLAKPAEVLA